MGLTIVHEVVVAHNGRIQVDSDPGRGSRFTIRLPQMMDRCALEKE